MIPPPFYAVIIMSSIVMYFQLQFLKRRFVIGINSLWSVMLSPLDSSVIAVVAGNNGTRILDIRSTSTRSRFCSIDTST